MKPELRRVGDEQSPVVIIDQFSGAADDIVSLANDLAPFPLANGNYYPGLRRVIVEADAEANTYVEATCNNAAQFIWGAFDLPKFDLEEASFSLVTRKPQDLEPVQRAPHFDRPEPTLLALIHYLRVPPNSGTAFYRHRATGIERVTPTNLDRLVNTARSEARRLPADGGYIHGSDEFYEEIGRVEAVPDRVVIYQGCLLHSGIIPADMSFSANPREGRLTANFFLLGKS